MPTEADVYAALLRRSPRTLREVASEADTTAATVSRTLAGIHVPGGQVRERLDAALAIGERKGHGVVEYLLMLVTADEHGPRIGDILTDRRGIPAVFGSGPLARSVAEILRTAIPAAAALPAWDYVVDEAMAWEKHQLLGGPRRLDVGDNHERIVHCIGAWLAGVQSEVGLPLRRDVRV